MLLLGLVASWASPLLLTLGRALIWPAVAVAVGWGLYTWGARDGRAACEARAAADAAASAEAFRKLDLARQVASDARAALARQLEDHANADPVSVPQCLSPDRVRRLNQIR